MYFYCNIHCIQLVALRVKFYQMQYALRLIYNLQPILCNTIIVYATIKWNTITKEFDFLHKFKQKYK